MERTTAKRVRKFNLDDAPVVAENERILGGTAASATNPVNSPTAVQSPAEALSASASPQLAQSGADVAHHVRKAKGKKTENGITVYVPMDYYERIMLMKMRTGVPIKDIALQAIMEFVDRHAND